MDGKGAIEILFIERLWRTVTRMYIYKHILTESALQDLKIILNFIIHGDFIKLDYGTPYNNYYKRI
jgi:hypothetical protein